MTLSTLGVAQDITGNLEGWLVNTQSQPVQRANIVVSSPGLQGIRGSTSDKKGRFRVPALPAGLYVIKITHISYLPTSLSDVRILLGKTSTTGAIRLQERNIELSDLVVTGERPAFDPASAATGAHIQVDDIKNLPLQRNYQEIATLFPQVNQSFLGDPMGVAGGTGLENKYFVDGIDVTDPIFANGGTNLPYNFIREVQVLRGGYEAEYRSSLGGILNVITNSGGNEFHGQVFGFYSNNRLSTEPQRGSVSEPPQGAFRQADIGINIRGPLLKDRLWFSCAYNPNFNKENILIPGIGYFPDKKTVQIFAAKLTWRASSRHHFNMSVFGDPANAEVVTIGWLSTPISLFLNPDPALTRVTSGTINLSLKGIHIINDHFVIESLLSRVSTQYTSKPRTPRGHSEFTYTDFTTGEASGGAGSTTNYWNKKYVVGLKGTLDVSQHSFKAGFEYIDSRFDDDVNWFWLLRTGVSTFATNQQIRKGRVSSRGPSFFIQDSWQLFRTLRINAGLRLDVQYLYASNGHLFQQFRDQYQPRFGVVWLPGGVEQHKVFASFGRFYQEVVTSTLSTFAFATNIFLLTNYDHDPRLDPSGGQINDFSSGIQPRLEKIKGQNYDEFSLGYENQLGSHLSGSIQGVYRILRYVLDDGFTPALGTFYWGNPGQGLLNNFPKPKREYKALELTIRNTDASRYKFFLSYVLSRTYGNYPGVFDADVGCVQPNFEPIFDLPELMVNATGLLPNDRTHVLKFFNSYAFPFGLNAGSQLIWQSGTPLNEFGGTPFNAPPWLGFVRQRGTAGRTPAIWDLNLRLSYDLAKFVHKAWHPRLVVDVFHIASPRKPVNYDQIHYYNLDEDGNQINQNSNYKNAISFQPPMAVRLGMEVTF
jgi:hypothetical protein